MTLAELDALLPTLPRRYPALLVDRLLACEPGRSASGMKCVTVGESHFQGHFPDYPVMPGVLMLEALIQLSTLLSCVSGQGTPGTVRSLDRAELQLYLGNTDIRHYKPSSVGKGNKQPGGMGSGSRRDSPHNDQRGHDLGKRQSEPRGNNRRHI